MAQRDMLISLGDCVFLAMAVRENSVDIGIVRTLRLALGIRVAGLDHLVRLGDGHRRGRHVT